MYDLRFTVLAEKQFSKLEKTIQKRIVSSLERIRIRPYSYIKKLVGNSYFRIRVGDYRVLLDINDGKLIILVIRLGHRKKIYKK